MAGRLMDKGFEIDTLISSPAIRAKQTAEHFARVLKMPAEEIRFISALYHAPAQVFYEVISALPDDKDSAALFSHNPGITSFVNSLSTKTQVDNMPTCGIFAVQVDIRQWQDFAKAKKEFLFFDYPKRTL